VKEDRPLRQIFNDVSRPVDASYNVLNSSLSFVMWNILQFEQLRVTLIYLSTVYCQTIIFCLNFDANSKLVI